MHINGLPDGVNSIVRLFANDALLCGTIFCDEDTADLENDYYRLEDRQEKWQMEFNLSKYKIICVLQLGGIHQSGNTYSVEKS